MSANDQNAKPEQHLPRTSAQWPENQSRLTKTCWLPPQSNHTALRTRARGRSHILLAAVRS